MMLFPRLSELNASVPAISDPQASATAPTVGVAATPAGSFNDLLSQLFGPGAAVAANVTAALAPSFAEKGPDATALPTRGQGQKAGVPSAATKAVTTLSGKKPSGNSAAPNLAVAGLVVPAPVSPPTSGGAQHQRSAPAPTSLATTEPRAPSTMANSAWLTSHAATVDFLPTSTVSSFDRLDVAAVPAAGAAVAGPAALAAPAGLPLAGRTPLPAPSSTALPGIDAPVGSAAVRPTAFSRTTQEPTQTLAPAPDGLAGMQNSKPQASPAVNDKESQTQASPAPAPTMASSPVTPILRTVVSGWTAAPAAVYATPAPPIQTSAESPANGEEFRRIDSSATGGSQLPVADRTAATEHAAPPVAMPLTAADNMEQPAIATAGLRTATSFFGQVSSRKSAEEISPLAVSLGAESNRRLSWATYAAAEGPTASTTPASPSLASRANHADPPDASAASETTRVTAIASDSDRVSGFGQAPAEESALPGEAATDPAAAAGTRTGKPSEDATQPAVQSPAIPVATQPNPEVRSSDTSLPDSAQANTAATMEPTIKAIVGAFSPVLAQLDLTAVPLVSYRSSGPPAGATAAASATSQDAGSPSPAATGNSNATVVLPAATRDAAQAEPNQPPATSFDAVGSAPEEGAVPSTPASPLAELLGASQTLPSSPASAIPVGGAETTSTPAASQSRVVPASVIPASVVPAFKYDLGNPPLRSVSRAETWLPTSSSAFSADSSRPLTGMQSKASAPAGPRDAAPGSSKTTPKTAEQEGSSTVSPGPTPSRFTAGTSKPGPEAPSSLTGRADPAYKAADGPATDVIEAAAPAPPVDSQAAVAVDPSGADASRLNPLALGQTRTAGTVEAPARGGKKAELPLAKQPPAGTNDPAEPQSPASAGPEAAALQSNSPQPAAAAPQHANQAAALAPAAAVVALDSRQGGRQSDPPSGDSQPQPSSSAPQEPANTASAPAVVQSARVLEHMGQTEMRVGVSTGDFGNVELRATVSQDHVGASINTSHVELRAAMMAEMPSLQRAMEQHQLRLDGLDLGANGGSHDRGASPQQHPRPPYGMQAGSRSSSSSDAMPSPEISAPSPSIALRSSGINVHA
jgi:hypothetical protein